MMEAQSLLHQLYKNTITETVLKVKTDKQYKFSKIRAVCPVVQYRIDT